ncbi:hypothetical protein B0H10DRAFT_2193152 [Mycena sp. CBHHK59/15]|nr:hypothetical protein B0H10DRAFT_2193152 [Mycena sp. CBHHK59/15]
MGNLPASDSDEDEDDHPANRFGGDYFGTYQEEDFDMDQEPEPADPNDNDFDDFDGLPHLAPVEESDSDSDSDGEGSVDLARQWEPQVLDNQYFPGVANQPDDHGGDAPNQTVDGDGAEGVPGPRAPTAEERAAGEQQVHQQPFIVEFTDGDAGAPLRRGEAGYDHYMADLGDPANTWAPFTSKLEWELAQWAKLRGPGSTAFTDLLKISGVTERLGLSYKNTRELNDIIDKKLPGRPKFKRKEIIVAGEAYDVGPERHYADKDETIRLYHNMHTGKWWWTTQPSRQAQILLVYLPTSKLEHMTVKASRRRVLANFFHTCMSKILEPLKDAGKDGMVVVSGDGVARRGHPILAAYVGDYPEQVLVTCVKNMDCPQCPELAKELGNAPVEGEPETFWDLGTILDALAAFHQGNPPKIFCDILSQNVEKYRRLLRTHIFDTLGQPSGHHMTEVTHRNVAVARIPVVGVLVVLRVCTKQQHVCEREWRWAAQAGQGQWRHGPVDGHRVVWEWRQWQRAPHALEVRQEMGQRGAGEGSKGQRAVAEGQVHVRRPVRTAGQIA